MFLQDLFNSSQETAFPYWFLFSESRLAEAKQEAGLMGPEKGTWKIPLEQ